jgi:hypothetical protein
MAKGGWRMADGGWQKEAANEFSSTGNARGEAAKTF